MKLLLDTHILLWLLTGDSRLSFRIRESIGDPANDLYVSIASFWEAAIKIGKGHLRVPGGGVESMFSYAAGTGISVIPIRTEHLIQLQTLPMLHKDPFDRIIFCQSQVERMVLVSNDRRMLAYAPAAMQ